MSTIDNYVQDRLQENIERITKLVYETISKKDKFIESLMNEKDTMNEKYRKYKRMAENARSTIKELEDKNKDIKSKADLREEMLTEERSKNQHLTEKATKTKLILETLAARGDKEGSGMGPLLKLLNGGKKTQGYNSESVTEISKYS